MESRIDLPEEIWVESGEPLPYRGQGWEHYVYTDLGNLAVHKFLQMLELTTEGKSFKELLSFLEFDKLEVMHNPEVDKEEKIPKYKIKINDQLALSPGEIIAIAVGYVGNVTKPIVLAQTIQEKSALFEQIVQNFLTTTIDSYSISRILNHIRDKANEKETDTHWIVRFVKEGLGYKPLWEPKQSEIFNNFDEFGQAAMDCYLVGHMLAMEKVKQAKLLAVSDAAASTKLLYGAFMRELIACHYLTSMYSVGHLRVPRIEMLNYLIFLTIEKTITDLESVSSLTLMTAVMFARKMHDKDYQEAVYLKQGEERGIARGEGNYYPTNYHSINYCPTMQAIAMIDFITGGFCDLMHVFYGVGIDYSSRMKRLAVVDEEENEEWERTPLFKVKEGKVMYQEDKKTLPFTQSNIPLLAHNLFKIKMRSKQTEELKEVSKEQIEQVYDKMLSTPGLKCSIL